MLGGGGKSGGGKIGVKLLMRNAKGGEAVESVVYIGERGGIWHQVGGRNIMRTQENAEEESGARPG